MVSTCVTVHVVVIVVAVVVVVVVDCLLPSVFLLVCLLACFDGNKNHPQLPLSLLRAATGSPLLVELKGGDTYNGRLQSIDAWMNMNLIQVICTSADGQTFTRQAAAYIRGSAIKYLRLPPSLLQEAAVQEAAAADERRVPYGGGGGGGGRGRGGGR